MINFNDVFKSSFIENVGAFSWLDAAMAIGLSFVMGLYIFFIYKKTYSGVMYSAGFGMSLVGMSMITSVVILAISSNVVLSLGMVGALSIVRFRTAIKEPMDIVFLFWAISQGIVLGAGLIPLGVIATLFTGLILFVFANRKVSMRPYMLVVNLEGDESERVLYKTIDANVKKHAVKSKTVNDSGVEVALEVRLKDNAAGFMNEIRRIEGIRSAALISYNGEYMS